MSEIYNMAYEKHNSNCPKCEELVIGNNDGIKTALKLANKVAKSNDTTTVIEGETGTGKELFAKIIHYNSNRSRQPFVCLNCSAVNKDLLESELFGYEKGTFTGGLQNGKMGKFEMANSGSIFLDEVTELIPDAQAKLLRVLEEREFYRVGGTERIRVDLRVIAATNKSLEKEVENGAFREDLYYRLNVIKIKLPPLRERIEDIIPIAHAFLNTFNSKFDKDFRCISEEAKAMLCEYSWPGNIRELRNVIEKVTLLEDSTMIRPQHLEFLTHARPGRKNKNHDMMDAASPQLFTKALQGSLKEDHGVMNIPASGISLDSVNKILLDRALKLNDGNISRTAKMLGISRAKAAYRINKYSIAN
jgi:two-component system, NtrC family, response regulator AtoC